MSAGRPPRLGSGTSPQQASRLSPLRPKAGLHPSPDRASAPSSRQGSGQLRQTGSTLSPQSSQPRQPSTSGPSSQSSQLDGRSVLSPHSLQPQWQSNSAYSPQGSMTNQQSTAAFRSQGLVSAQQSNVSMQQAPPHGVTFTSTPRFQTADTEAATPSGSAPEGSLQQPWLQSQAPSPAVSSSQPRLQVNLPPDTQVSVPHDAQTTLGSGRGSLAQAQGSTQVTSASETPLQQQRSTASQQTQASTSTPQGRAKGSRQQPRTSSGMQRQGWFQDDVYDDSQDDDSQDPNLHNPRYAMHPTCGNTLSKLFSRRLHSPAHCLYPSSEP